MVRLLLRRVATVSAAAAVGRRRRQRKDDDPTCLNPKQIERMGGRAAAMKHLKRVAQELTWYGGVLCFRQQWPWLAPDDADRLYATGLSVNRKKLRFATADSGGHDAAAPAVETRAHRAREGYPFGMNLDGGVPHA